MGRYPERTTRHHFFASKYAVGELLSSDMKAIDLLTPEIYGNGLISDQRKLLTYFIEGNDTDPGVSGSYCGFVDVGSFTSSSTPSVLVSLNGQWPAEASAQAPGEIIYNGEHFGSPSAAASSVRQGGAANGWAFWGAIRDGQSVPLAVLRSKLDAQ